MIAGIFGVGSGTDLAASATTVARSLGAGASGPLGPTTGTTVAGRTSAVNAAASGSTPAKSSSTPGDITSNDFLTLLVTEMKNQDPTQPTDPNAYIQQLTEVNSLQQLIAINQDLTKTPGTSGSGSAGASPVAATTGV